jgi:hypothetical protein
VNHTDKVFGWPPSYADRTLTLMCRIDELHLDYLTFYNSRRPHSSLDRQTPDQACFQPPTPMMVAA